MAHRHLLNSRVHFVYVGGAVLEAEPPFFCLNRYFDGLIFDNGQKKAHSEPFKANKKGANS